MKRREFLKSTGLSAVALAEAGFFIAAAGTPGAVASPNEKLNIGFVGVGGMRGAAHLSGCQGETIAALCDVDDRMLGAAARRHDKAATYHDFRKMIEKEKSLDAVVVSTPDHIHAPAIAAALRAGKHVYCEKPLTHSVYEARVIEQLAAKHRAVTQMGTQIHSGGNYRRVVELVRAGTVGTVKEVHVWLGGGRWSAGDRPKEGPPVPDNLHWDLWLGPAAERPYHKEYHPQNWRKWWAFGGGTLADMGCHYTDLAFWALQLKHPMRVRAEGPPVHPDGAPKWLHVTWEFPAWAELAPVTLHWYHGDRRPEAYPPEKLGGWRGAGVLFVGDKGMIVANYGRHALLPEEKFADTKRPEPWIPDSIGHHKEWLEACKTGGPTTCNFQYSGALTETILLGNVAYRSGKAFEWDAANLKARNCPEADAFLRREYRKGWSL